MGEKPLTVGDRVTWVQTPRAFSNARIVRFGTHGWQGVTGPGIRNAIVIYCEDGDCGGKQVAVMPRSLRRGWTPRPTAPAGDDARGAT